MQFRPIHLRQLEVAPGVNPVRPCSCPWKPHNGCAVFCLFLSSFHWDHVQVQAIEWRWVASICMRVIMQFGRVGKHVWETSQIVRKLIPMSNGDEPKAASLLLLKEILGECTEVFCSRASAQAHGHVSVPPFRVLAWGGKSNLPGYNSGSQFYLLIKASNFSSLGFLICKVGIIIYVGELGQSYTEIMYIKPCSQRATQIKSMGKCELGGELVEAF